MSAADVSDELRELMAENGRKGGRSKSEKKLAAVRANMEKALEARWNKKFKGRLRKKT